MAETTNTRAKIFFRMSALHVAQLVCDDRVEFWSPSSIRRNCRLTRPRARKQKHWSIDPPRRNDIHSLNLHSNPKSKEEGSIE
jgi:hypothetical protein